MAVSNRFHFWISLVRMIGIIVPRRLRADWKQEWVAELQYRERLLADWDRLNWRAKLNLFRRSLGAFSDALILQPQRLEDEMFQDLSYGIRVFARSPGFTAVVMLTLALGIGVNTALFSVVNAVVLSPMPYPNPDQLVTIHQSKQNFQTGAVPYPNFLDLQKENTTFSAMAVSRGYGFTLIGNGDAERVSAQFVTADFFSILGIEPIQGRNFTADEDQRGKAPVVLISSPFCQRKFGGNGNVVGSTLTLDDRSYTIVGVLPASFSLRVSIFQPSDLYVPIGQWNNPALQNRGAALALHGIGRLKPDVTIEQAQLDLDRVMSGLAVAYPATNRGNGAKIVALKQRVIGNIGTTLWMLLGAVGFVLLIACVNVSNLLLARSTGRTREFAIRAALGAGEWRLFRQSITESTLLALAGGGLGLLLGGWITHAAISVLPATLPRSEEIGLDWRVLVFTAGISLLTGTLAGLAPALRISRRQLSEMLKQGGRGVSGSRTHAQGVLVAVEMAMALVLLIGAGLMIRSISSLWKVDPGFRPDNVLTCTLSLPPALRDARPEMIRSALRQMSDELNSSPGIQSATFVDGSLPLMGDDETYFWLASQPTPASQSEMNMTVLSRVEPTYLATMGIPLKQGRFFTSQDDERAPRVAVIDEAFAGRYFANEDPIGKQIRTDGRPETIQIVGVVGHVKQWSIAADEKISLQAQMYLPFRSESDNTMRAYVAGVTMVTHSDAAAPVSLESIRRLVQGISRESVVSEAVTMNEAINESLASRRFAMILLNTFAAMALLLASLGIYGVISYLVGQRTNELGIRLALGAQRSDVLRLVLGQGLKMTASGVALGLVSSLALTRLVSKILYGVSATDPLTFVVVALILMVVAILACIVPARRATKVDPLTALRHE